MKLWRREEMERMRAWRPRSDEELRLEHLTYILPPTTQKFSDSDT